MCKGGARQAFESLLFYKKTINPKTGNMIMKHFQKLLILSLALIMTSCNSDENKIRKTAQGYLDATGNYRIEEAYPYATEATRESTLKYISEVIMPMTDSNYIKSNIPATIVIDSIILKNDTAFALYTKTTPLKTSNSVVCLIRENGKWLVHMPIDLSLSPIRLPKSKEEADSISRADTTFKIDSATISRLRKAPRKQE